MAVKSTEWLRRTTRSDIKAVLTTIGIGALAWLLGASLMQYSPIWAVFYLFGEIIAGVGLAFLAALSIIGLLQRARKIRKG